MRFNRSWLALCSDAFSLREPDSIPHHVRDRLRSKAPWLSKPQGHADMAARKAQPLVKSLRIDASVMRQQFDQFASPGPRFRNRPLHHLLADAAAAAVFGDADILDQAE
jgi:hypothetical protein